MKLLRIQVVGPRRFVGLLMTIALGAGALAMSSLGLKLELGFGQRWLYNVRGPLAPPADVALIRMDDSSAGALGLDVDVARWPRLLHACLIERLHTLGAAGVVMDIDFHTEADPGAAIALEPTSTPYCEWTRTEDGTARLAQAIAQSGRVLLISYQGQRLAEDAGVSLQWLRDPAPALAAAALGVAPFALPRFDDQKFRYWTFLPWPDAATGDVPSLAAMAVQATYPDTLSALPTVASGGLRGAMLAARQRVATEPAIAARLAAAGPWASRLYGEHTERLLNIYGPPDEGLTTLDYEAVLQANANSAVARQLRGSVVFIGAAEHETNSDLDQHFTAYPNTQDRKYGGVELLATAYANLRDGTDLHALTGWQSLLLTVALAGCVGIAGWYCRLPVALAVCFALTALYLALAAGLFAQARIWLPVVIPALIAMPVLMLATSLLQYLASEATWRRIYAIADRFVSLKLVRDYLEPTRVYGTLLVSDAANFTRVIERYGADPVAMVPFLNAYYEALSTPVQQAKPEGMIADIAGDGMMTVWPSDDQSSSLPSRRAACLAACEIRMAVARFNQNQAMSPLPTRIGLHAGTVALGPVLMRGRSFIKPVGSATNVASRIEGLNKRLQTTVLASAAAVEGLEQVFLLRSCGRFRLPGLQQALDILEVVGPHAAVTAADHQRVAAFSHALHLFDSGDRATALAAFEALLVRWPEDGPGHFYRERCMQQASPEAGDAGVIVIENK